jgi:predicted nucleic acid-binding protein
MVTNEQAIRAFGELLALFETTDARADASFELLQKRAPVTEQELKHIWDEARARSKTKFDRLRATLKNVLKEDADI